LGADIETLIAQVEGLIGDNAPPPYPRRWLGLKLLEGDREITAIVRDHVDAERWAEIQALLRNNEDAVVTIASARYEWIGRMVRAAVTRPRASMVSLTERLDRVATHPVGGSLLMIAVLALMFWAVFQLSAPLVRLLESGLEWLSGWVRTLLAGAPGWVTDLLTNGVIGGAGTVLTLLPVLAIFFAAIAFLEDVGYLARGAFVADRLMHHMGLHGKSFLPLFLGFGCNVPSVLGSRILDSPRDRLLTQLIAPLVPCAGRMAVLAFVAAALFGRHATLVMMALIALSLLMLVVSGSLLNRLLFRGERPAFIMELPLYHLPNWKSIGLRTWQHLVDFVTRAGTVILGLSVAIWALATLPSGAIETSWLAAVGRLLAPIGKLIGLDWRMMVALLASLVAKEQSLATLAVLLATEEASLTALLPQIMGPAAGLAFLVVQMLTIPCVGTFTAMRRESGSWRWTLVGAAYQALLALALGIVVYQLARLGPRC
jgi:ferrous iron transport protein B